MIGIIGFVFGALLGAIVAYRRKGNWLDMLHYAAVIGMFLGVLALFVAVVASRIAGS